jgi:hypothetical protein
MPPPEGPEIDALMRAAMEAAAPSPQEAEAAGQRWLRSGVEWRSERQIAFNRAVVELLRALQQRAESHYARIDELEQRLVDAISLRQQLQQLQSQIERNDTATRAATQELTQRLLNEQQQRIDQLTESLGNEQRERIRHVLDEQRVCVRQLSLQNSEATVLAERARRAAELRLEELVQRVDQLGAAPTA